MIDPFPGKLSKEGHRYVLDEEQTAWLRKWHPCTENKVLETVLNISHSTLARFVKELGLTKSEEGFREIMRRKGQKRMETWRKERARVVFGLQQKTRMYVPLKKYNSAQLSCRAHALEKGYVLARDCREGTGGRWTIYFDKNTPRDAVFERNCVKNGFAVREWIDTEKYR